MTFETIEIILRMMYQIAKYAICTAILYAFCKICDHIGCCKQRHVTKGINTMSEILSRGKEIANQFYSTMDKQWKERKEATRLRMLVQAHNQLISQESAKEDDYTDE